MKNINLKNFFSNKQVTIVLSILIAIVLWFYAVGINSPDSTATITDIPITVDISNTQAYQLDLAVSEIQPKKVSVSVTGPRYKISQLNASDFTVSPTSMSNVTGADTYELQLKASLNDPQNGVYISGISPNRANFTFDTVSKKELDLTAEAPNIKVEDGYILENPVAQPEKIIVEGPKSDIMALEKVKIITEISGTLNASKTYNGVPYFYDANGNELDRSKFKYNTDIKFKVTVPVYKSKDVPLSVKFKNAPKNFNLDSLSYTITPPSINVAGVSEAAKNLSDISIGYIDMRELDIGKSFSFSIPLPSGFKNVSSETVANVTFNDSNWESKIMTLKDIQLANIPSDYNVSIENSSINDVKIVGLKEGMNGITEADITATVDLTNQVIQEGVQSLPVTIDLVSKNNVWPVGKYTCNVKITKK